jgi:KDO2-lipid IV(A) lauroyltransferase
MKKKIKHRIEYVLFLGLGFLIRLLPVSALHHAASLLVDTLYPLLKTRRNVAIQNLSNAYPEKQREELEKIARGSFKSVAAALLELLWVPRFTVETLKRFIVIENPDFLLKTVASGKGCILISAHFGNWELNALVTKSHLAVPCIAVEKVQSNPLIHRCIHEYRKKFGAVVLPMELSVREIFKTLQAGGAVEMAVDQAAAMESIEAEFFGRYVPTFQGPAVFSLRTGAPILVGLAVRQPDGTYKVKFHKVPSDDLIGASKENIAELTQRHTKLTEQLIREHPEQWMWMHKRWKHALDRKQVSL